MATEARPAIITFTGLLDRENVAAASRFSDVVRQAAGGGPPDLIRVCSELAARAFGGDRDAWGPLVVAVRRLLNAPAPAGPRAIRSRRDLHAFVAENADLLET